MRLVVCEGRERTPVRAMIFRVKRVTPGKPPKASDYSTYRSSAERDIRLALPFDVEVHDEPEQRDGYVSPCRCETVFRITDDSMRDLKKRGMIDGRRALKSNVCVCLCMGQIVDGRTAGPR
jgi:hypothetical protein